VARRRVEGIIKYRLLIAPPPSYADTVDSQGWVSVVVHRASFSFVDLEEARMIIHPGASPNAPARSPHHTGPPVVPC
jgi:hypothetical protein